MYIDLRRRGPSPERVIRSPFPLLHVLLFTNSIKDIMGLFRSKPSQCPGILMQ